MYSLEYMCIRKEERPENKYESWEVKKSRPNKVEKN